MPAAQSWGAKSTKLLEQALVPKQLAVDGSEGLRNWPGPQDLTERSCR